tara:strand:+ start:82 stop:825 length:744 start_codon:yes stop_codon:yes gene_type:complete
MGFFKTIKRKFYKVNDIFSKKLSISNENFIITGCNSGIGFQLVKFLKDKQNNILAFVNNNDENIKNLEDKNFNIIKCDFNKPENINNYSKQIENFKPSIIINCAAIFGSNNQKIDDLLIEDFISVINVNVLAPVLLIQKSLKSNSLKQIINVTSEMGSISNNKNGNYYLYRSSKSLLNAITKNLSIDLKKNNINVLCIHPGDVKTKLNSAGLISAEMAAQKIINICSKNSFSLNGKFIDADLKNIKW